MYIREIRIKNYRNLRDVNLGPFPPPTTKSDLVVLAGPNGGGKSSVLETIGYALSNSWGVQWGLRRSFPDHSFEIAIGLTDVELSLLEEFFASYGAVNYINRNFLDYLIEQRHYYRRFSSQGEYKNEADNQIHDACHHLITVALRLHYQRDLGFFLKADRNYPLGGFKWQNTLFDHEKMREKNYIWSLAYTTSDLQYRDMYEFLIQQRFHYINQLGEYYNMREMGALPENATKPENPLKPYGTLLTKIFPQYAFGEKSENPPKNLYVKLPDDVVIPFTDLSSGEKEVFFILSSFIRHSVSNAVIAIDEPELHLHPELSRKLIREMLELKPENQIWLATHNAEIIDEAGRDKTIYISRGNGTESEVVLGSDETAASIQLRSLFGVSGYIGIAKNMVFLEGEMSSADRKMLSWLFPGHAGTVKLIPTGGVNNLGRINSAILSILEVSISQCQFYLIRDKDYLTPTMISEYNNHTSGRLYILEKNQIENYLLNETAIAGVLRDVFQVEKTTNQIHRDLVTICRGISGEVLRDMVSFRLNLLYRPQDFSLGKLLERQSVLDANNEWLTEQMDGFTKNFLEKVQLIDEQLKEKVSAETLEHFLDECKIEVKSSITSEGWRDFFPGKRLLDELARRYELKNPIAFQNSLIKELASNPSLIPPELSRVMNLIAEGKKLTD